MRYFCQPPTQFLVRYLARLDLVVSGQSLSLDTHYIEYFAKSVYCETMPSNLAILISGQGSNLQAIIDAIASGIIENATVRLVISNKKNAFGLERARVSRIETAYLNLISYSKQYPDPDPLVKYSSAAREAYDADLAETVLNVKPDLVVLAGFMHVCSISYQSRHLNACPFSSDIYN